ncbi:MAG TPA: MFS transporter, partial [Verrucomicrobiae bacterium]
QAPPMSSRHLKAGSFVLTWLNIYAVAYYFNYLFFHLRDDFGFGNRENLLFAALNGLIYIPSSWFGGKFAQRHGCYAALKVGLGAMTVLLAVGSCLTGLAAQTIVMSLWTLAVCFTWAPLEALASENESRTSLAQMLGLYNIVWSSGAAVAYFTGGLLQKVLWPGSLYWLPACIHATQLALVLWLERQARTFKPVRANDHPPRPEAALPHVPPSLAKSFLRMAWLANPFAYVAMNTIIPLIPNLAVRLNLSTALAGFVASVWMFARLFAFVLLWRWTAWHYRFGWLLASYVVMVASFAALLLVPNLAVIVVAQLAFGLAVGLIYFSSLFYSMDVGETKGEHGGFHEAIIGVGIFTGPAVGAAALRLLPGLADAGIWTVSGLLMAGLAGLLALRRRR